MMGQATLHGVITDDGWSATCSFRFQYGKTIALGTFTPWAGGNLTTGSSFQQTITGLAGNTIYYFRAECRNAIGVGTPGAILSFITTAAAEASIGVMAATNIGEYKATLNGVVLSDGDKPGAVRFNYGATIAYGMVTGWQQGFATGDEFHAELRGLSPETAYHFRAEFQSSPSVFSKDGSFTTLAEIGGLTLLTEDILATILGG